MLQSDKILVMGIGLMICGSALSSGSARAAEPPPETSQSAPRSTMVAPSAVASFGAASADNWLYILGGHTGREHEHSTANLSSAFFRLNLLDRTTWEKLPGGVGLQSVSLVAYDGCLYRVGGMKALNAPGEAENLHSVAEVAKFDPVTRRWEPLPPLPEPRSSHDATVLNGKLYVAGGWTLNGSSDSGQWLKTAWVMDLESETPRWEALPEAPFQRRAVALAAVDGKLYVMGGIGPDRKTSPRVDVLDLERNEWTSGPELPDNGFGVSAIVIEGQVYVSGLNGTLHQLDAIHTTWRPAARLQFPRFFHRLVKGAENEILAVGGAARGGHLRQIETIRLDARPAAYQAASVWSMPYPGREKNRQGLFVHNNRLYLFGGNTSLGQHDFEPENFSAAAFSVHPGSLLIEQKSPFPVRRQSMVTAVIDNSRAVGYAIGGFGHDGEVARTFDDAFCYHFEDDRWEPLGRKLPAPLTQFGLVARGSELWAFGGLDYDPRRAEEDHFRHSRSILMWDTFDERGTFKPIEQTLPEPRRAFGCAAIGDRVYIVGGMREGFAPVEECGYFDLATRTWTTIPSPSRPRISPELVAINGRLYLIGGTSRGSDDRNAPDERIEVYDPAKERWTVLPERLPIPARHVRAVPFGENILLFSTQVAGENAMHMAIFRPEAGETTLSLNTSNR